VHLNLEGAAALAAYRDLARRLGPRALVQAMAPPGVELILGARVDPQFGPMVVLGAGGILVELLGDSVAALAPFDESVAAALLGRLKVARLLDGPRGRPKLARAALIETVARFSQLLASLGSALAEVDINPLIVHETGVVAVDALIVPRNSQGSHR
jgi:hypothetical protein